MGITNYSYGESTNVNQLQLGLAGADLTFDAEYQWTKALGIDGPNEEAVTDQRNIRCDNDNLDFLCASRSCVELRLRPSDRHREIPSW